jgi:hypothetical protein
MIKVQMQKKMGDINSGWITFYEFPSTGEGMKYALIEYQSHKHQGARVLWDGYEVIWNPGVFCKGGIK